MTSLLKSPAACLDEAVQVVKTGLEDQGDDFLGLILTGSAARGEMTIIELEGRMRWLSDLEFLVAVDSPMQVPRAKKQLELLSERLGRQLLQKGQEVEIELSPVPRSFFGALTPRIFYVELKEHGRQILGGEDFLGLVPQLEGSAISRQEAFRLLSNRLVERLDAELKWRELAPVHAAYGLSKLALDVLTSSAIFVGAYESSYSGRYERRNEVFEWWRREGLDSGLIESFSGILATAMAFKEQPRPSAANQPDSLPWKSPADLAFADIDETRTTLIEFALSVWSLQLARLVGESSSARQDLSGLDLLSEFEGWSIRPRAWAAAIAKTPSPARWRVLTRSLRQISSGTPRSFTYGSAWALLKSRTSRDPELLQWVDKNLPTAGGPTTATWDSLADSCVSFWRSVLRMSST